MERKGRLPASSSSGSSDSDGRLERTGFALGVSTLGAAALRPRRGEETAGSSLASGSSVDSDWRFVLLACGLATSFLLAAAGLRPLLTGVLTTGSSLTSSSPADDNLRLAGSFGVLVLGLAGLRPRLGVLGTSSGASSSSTGSSDFPVDCARLLARGFGVLDFGAGPALRPRRGASTSSS